MTMVSDSSLRSARLYSLAILVLCYVGLSFVWSHQQRLAILSEARTAMAEIIVATNNDASFAALGEITRSVTTGSSQFFFGGSTTTVRILVTSPDGGQWGVVGVDASILNSQSAIDDNRALLSNIAARQGNFESSEDNLTRLYSQIEQAILSTEVLVPGVGLGFRGMQVVWVSVIACFGFLVILRDRVQHVLTDKGLAMSERWLVIDAREGIERFISQLWLIALIVAPLALCSGLIMGITTQIAADGATSPLLGDIFAVIGVLFLLAGNAWLTLTSASRILELREKRLRYTSPT